jgi:serine protease Do
MARRAGVGWTRLARRTGAIVMPAALCLVLAGQAAFARTAPESFADLAEKLLPSVVNISTSQTIRGDRNRGPGFQVPPGSPFEEFFKEFFDRQREQNRPRRATSLGSGFIVDSAGYIVTNNHVISEADEINVILHDNTTLQAEIVGRDPKTDLALLKVESDAPLVGLDWGDSDVMRVGDWVLAIGNPFGLGGTVTAGIVSARERDINAGPYDDFLQTDASINRGNSGGPMFDLNGHVIGINTAIFSPSGGSVGIGFAIPSNLAKPVIDQLRKYGRTRRGWLGVRIQMVTDEIAESLGLGEPRGALVASVTKEGPSEQAKIQPGDVILTFDNRPVKEMRELPRMVAETDIGKAVDVTVWRDEAEVQLQVTLGELEEAEAAALTETESGAPETDTFDDLGLVLSDVSSELREQYELGEDVKGVVITDVAEDSPAGQKGLRPGDVIVEVGQEEVASPSDVAQRIKEARDSGRKSVLMLVDRQGDLRFVAIRIDAG